MRLEIPFIPGILILLFISIVFARFWSRIANLIGEQIRMFFINAWKLLKNKG